jgi:hypothetical protein
LTAFAQLKRACMDVYAEKIVPWLQDGRDGHKWSARFELAAIVERITMWLQQPGIDLFDRADGIDSLEFFKSLPDARYSVETCAAELKRLTLEWTGGKAHT